MLNKFMMQEIIDLKLQGYTVAGIRDYYEARGIKPPSMPTIRKYYGMDVLPDDPGEKLEKPKVFDEEPFRSEIIKVLENNRDNKSLCISSVYDFLEEKFIENGDLEALPGNPQTLRNYVHYLEDHGIVAATGESGRVYDTVFDTAPGEQMLIDFGEIGISRGLRVHFICLLLRYSRYLVVFAQDHKYNAEEACSAIYRAFCRLGGRPTTLVIDQDAVFVASETYGEVVETRVFKDFCAEQELKLWVCHKADPESKGPVENSVGFVKKNFFSSRMTTIESINDVWRSLPGWLNRKNKRIHQTTYCVPEEILNDLERNSLRPVIPSYYENSPNSFTEVKIGGYPFIKYRTCKYSVPKECCYHTVFFKVTGSKMHVYDESKRFVCTHSLSECRGRTIQLDEHKHQPNDSWMPIVERMRQRWNCPDFQHFINGVKKENPRYLVEQFSAIEDFLNKKDPDRATVAVVLKLCCENWRYRFSQFKEVFMSVEQGQISWAEYIAPMDEVQKQALSTYQKAFNDRCRSTGSEVTS
jgi:hypothetical protein